MRLITYNKRKNINQSVTNKEPKIDANIDWKVHINIIATASKINLATTGNKLADRRITISWQLHMLQQILESKIT